MLMLLLLLSPIPSKSRSRSKSKSKSKIWLHPKAARCFSFYALRSTHYIFATIASHANSANRSIDSSMIFHP